MNEDLYYRRSDQPRTKISITQMKFPGGEVGVNVNPSLNYDEGGVQDITLSVRAKNSDNLMAAFMATDALRRIYHNAKIHLEIPYFPYARQDRVCNDGEALSVAVMARLINSMGYATVSVLDPHSPALVAALDRCLVRDQFSVFGHLKIDWMAWTIVAPDAGATKKCEIFAKRVGAKGVVTFAKDRELSTGKILGMKVIDGELKDGEQYFVLDDICDGGRTFIELAKFMPFTSTLELAVTHGIFSKGIDVVSAKFDKVHTTNSFHGDLNTMPCSGDLNIIYV